MPDKDKLRAQARPQAACRAVDAILLSGRGYERLDPWRLRLGAILAAAMPPRQRAALLLRLALIALLRDADGAAARPVLAEAIALVDDQRPGALLLVLSALAGIADSLAGCLVLADVQLAHAEFRCRGAAIPSRARGWLDGARALNRLFSGDAAGATEALAGSGAAPQNGSADRLRLQLSLYAAALRGEPDRVAELSERIARSAIPERPTLLHAGRHFVLGVAALCSGQALRAQVHAQECASIGARAGSRLAPLLSALLQAQALADLQQPDQARALLLKTDPDWTGLGLGQLAAAGRLELAGLLARSGQSDRARQAIEAARELLPVGERLGPLHRSADWLPGLQARLGDSGLPPSRLQPPIRIHTRGEFSVEIGGRRLYDRDWKGQRTRSLLLALIGEGGYKVPIERLSDRLWPDSDGDQALQNLKVALHRLRRLGRGHDEAPLNWVHVKHGCVSLSRGLCWVDVLADRAPALDAPDAGVGPPAAL